MNISLARAPRPSVQRMVGRAALLALVIAGVVLCWNAIRRDLVYGLARINLGNARALPLIVTAIGDRMADPALALPAVRDRSELRQSSATFSGRLSGAAVAAYAPSSSGERSLGWLIVDDRLNKVGQIMTSLDPYRELIDDRDGDGRIELATADGRYVEGERSYAVVRIAGGENQLLAICSEVPIPSAAPTGWFGAHWRAGTPGQRDALEITEYTAAGGQSIHLRLDWSAGGDLFVDDPGPGTLRVWLPSGGEPVLFPPEEPLDSVMKRVLAEHDDRD